MGVNGPHRSSGSPRTGGHGSSRGTQGAPRSQSSTSSGQTKPSTSSSSSSSTKPNSSTQSTQGTQGTQSTQQTPPKSAETRGAEKAMKYVDGIKEKLAKGDKEGANKDVEKLAKALHTDPKNLRKALGMDDDEGSSSNGGGVIRGTPRGNA